MFGTAVKWQLMDSNPCERVTPPKLDETDVEFLDEGQIASLLEALPDAPTQLSDVYKRQVLSARSVAVLAILSASCLVFLVGFRLTTTLTFSLSTSLLYTIAQVHSICKLHKGIHLHKYKLYTCASTDCVL